MANSPSRGAWRCTRHRKSCSRSSAVGAPKETTLTPRGLRQPATCLIAPSLPALSLPCSTTSALLSLAPHIASWRANISSPSAANRRRAVALVMPFGGSGEIRSSRTFSPRSVKTILVFGRKLDAGEERVVEAEAREVADAHRVEHPVEVIDLVLHYASVEAFD